MLQIPPLRQAAKRCTEIPSGFPYNEPGFAPARSPSGLRTTWILHKAKPCAKPCSLCVSFGRINAADNNSEEEISTFLCFFRDF